ncbi:MULTISPECIES: glycosyltransferase family 4 protein [unclassified Carboxylicivirga]|uniref:glycosyltransferase family 4 protein n=1 Tax=Carboxylicivirga TaxID=1628153 RepID=UPI003D347A7D
MKKLRVVHVEDRFHPDMGYQLNFTAKFHCADVDMHIVCSNSLKLFNHEGLTSELIRAKDEAFEKEYGVTIHRLPVRYEKKNGYNLLMKGVRKKILSLQPDVLFVHALESYTAFSLLMNNGLYKKCLVCADTHTLDNQFKGGVVERLYFKLLKRLVVRPLRRYKAPVFYTAAENKNILLSRYCLADDQVYPYLIGTDPKVFYPDEDAGNKLRETLGIAERHIILYAGKFNQPKSPHLVIEALNKLDIDLSDVCLLMLGGKTAPYYSETFLLCKENSKVKVIVKDAVRVADLNAYYNMATLAVFPRENTLSALDAQLCKLPLVMEADLTNNERLSKGGLTYEKGNISAMAAAIQQLLGDDERRRIMGENGYAFVKANYSYQSIIASMEAVLFDRLKQLK